MMMERPERHLADSIVYLCALLADRPRTIDDYIDYFGGWAVRSRSVSRATARN
jgi:hypothetical protein